MYLVTYLRNENLLLFSSKIFKVLAFHPQVPLMGKIPWLNTFTAPGSGAILRPLLLTPPFSPPPTTILLPLSLNLLQHPGLTLVLSQLGFSVVSMVLTALSLKFSLFLLRHTLLVTYTISIFPFCLIKRTQFCLR